LRHFFNSLLERCVISKKAEDAGNIRVQQVSYLGNVTEVEVYMPYGMSANIPAGALSYKFIIGGDDGNIVVLADDSKNRPKGLQESEVAVFNPVTQSRTVYKQSGDVDLTLEKGSHNITVANGNCYINTPNGEVRIND
jgi:phage gp45-like